jgi:hypothetical protein
MTRTKLIDTPAHAKFIASVLEAIKTLSLFKHIQEDL